VRLEGEREEVAADLGRERSEAKMPLRMRDREAANRAGQREVNSLVGKGHSLS
jgi:hypothetical protein